MSLATLCSGLALRVGVQATAPWFGSPDLTSSEVVAFVQEGLRQVAGEFDWQALIRETEWTANGDDPQALPLPADLERLIPDTLWVEGQNDPLQGPLSPAEWARWEREAASETRAFSLAGGQLMVRGVQAGEVVRARYKSSALTASGGPAFATDADTSLLDERLVGMAAEMLYRDAKGLPAGAAARYPVELDKARAADQPIGVLSMGRRGHRRAHAYGSPNVVSGDGNLGILL